jgi:hypothetical protein
MEFIRRAEIKLSSLALWDFVVAGKILPLQKVSGLQWGRADLHEKTGQKDPIFGARWVHCWPMTTDIIQRSLHTKVV